MEDMAAVLWTAQMDTDAIGRVIQGLGVLTTRYEDLWLIVEDSQPDPIKSKDIGINLGGITIGGRLLVPFCNVKRWDLDSGEPCVAFDMAGKMALFAPATAPEDDQFVREMEFLLTRDWCSSDIIYLSNLDGPCGDRNTHGKTPDSEITVLWEPVREATDLQRTDTVQVLGESLRLDEITWMERETDGDGNRYGHIVMTDGRYRRIALGDLGR